MLGIRNLVFLLLTEVVLAVAGGFAQGAPLGDSFFAAGEPVVLDVFRTSEGEPSGEDWSPAVEAIARSLRDAFPGLDVRTALTLEDHPRLGELLIRRAPRLLGEADRRELARCFEPERLAASLSSQGAPPEVQRLQEVLGIADVALGPFARCIVGRPDVVVRSGRIASADGRHRFVLVRWQRGSTNGPSVRELEDALRRVTRTAAEDEFIVRILPRLGPDDGNSPMGSLLLAGSACGALLLVLLALISRRPWMVWLPFLPTVLGVATILWLFAPRTIEEEWVAGCVAVLAGLALHLSVDAHRRSDGGEEGARRGTYLFGFLGTCVVAATFLSLCTTSLAAAGEIASHALAATLVAALLSVQVVPRVSLGPLRRPLVDGDSWLVWLRSKRSRRALVVMTILLTPVVSCGLLWLRPGESGAREGVVAGDGTTPRVVSVRFSGRSLEEVLANGERLARWLDREWGEGTVLARTSPRDLLPSRRTQDRRLQSWRAFWSAERVAAVRSAAPEHLTSAVESLLAWAAREPTTVTLADYERTAARPLLARRLSRSGQRYEAETTLAAGLPPAALEYRVEEQVPGATVRAAAGLLTGWSGECWWMLPGIVLLGLFAVSFLGLGWLELALLVTLPALVGALWVLGLLGWLRLPLDGASAVGLLFVLGGEAVLTLGVVRGYLAWFRRDGDVAAPSVVTAMCLSLAWWAGFLVLSVTADGPLATVGLVGSVGIPAQSVGPLLLAPALAQAFLCRRGPYGTPRLRNLWAGWWVFRLMVGRALGYLIVRRRRLSPEEREREAIETIRRMCVDIRYRLAIGRRIYVEYEPERAVEPSVVVANHESIYDIVGLLALPRPMKFLAKPRVGKMPVMGPIVRDAGYIFVPGTAPEDVVELARASVERGISILAFPEGTRSRDGKVARFRKGAFVIAKQLGVPVIPVALVNVRSVSRPDTWWVGDHDVRVVVLEPLDPAEFPGEDGERRMARAARERICEVRERLWLETQTGPEWYRPLAGAYRYLGPVVGRYAASKLRRDPLVEALPHLCRGDEEILVAGCGFGIMTSRLVLAYPRRRIRAVDHDERKVRIAKAALGEPPGVSLVVGDVRKVELGSPGLALLVDVLHYWPEEDQKSIVERVAGALAPGGRLIFRDQSTERSLDHVVGWAGEAWARLIGFHASRGRFYFRDSDGWCKLLESCGLVVESARPDLHPFSGTVLMCRKVEAGSRRGSSPCPMEPGQ